MRFSVTDFLDMSQLTEGLFLAGIAAQNGDDYLVRAQVKLYLKAKRLGALHHAVDLLDIDAPLHFNNHIDSPETFILALFALIILTCSKASLQDDVSRINQLVEDTDI